jgi:hypothetical protein
MKASKGLARLSELALRQRRLGLAMQLPPVTEILRGSLVQRYVTCGNPSCKCAKGERHGPMWYLTVTLGPGRTTGGIVATEKVEQVRGWVNNYHKVKEHLEKILRDQSGTAAARARPTAQTQARNERLKARWTWRKGRCLAGPYSRGGRRTEVRRAQRTLLLKHATPPARKNLSRLVSGLALSKISVVCSRRWMKNKVRLVPLDASFRTSFRGESRC